MPNITPPFFFFHPHSTLSLSHSLPFSHILLTMVGRTKSETKKLQIARSRSDNLMKRALHAYLLELQKKYPACPKGARTICKDFETLNRQETGEAIKLSYATLIRLSQGAQLRSEANAARSWLTDEETAVVIAYVKELAACGFPLSHRRLKEHVDDILRARLGNKFLATGVGKNWTARFVEKHSDQLQTSWARPLESKRGRAVNPATNEAWFTLLGDTLTKYNIKEENIYGVDEVGCQPSGGVKERVVGGRGLGPQYQQRDGNRETITILVVICANGTALEPLIIYKGLAYQIKWQQDNPTNASYVTTIRYPKMHANLNGKGSVIQRRGGLMARLGLYG
jgi:hypothetical protein